MRADQAGMNDNRPDPDLLLAQVQATRRARCAGG